MNTFLFDKFRLGKGVVLVSVMWVIVLLTVVITTVAKTSRLDTRISLARADKVRSKWTCRAGVETAIAVLNDDFDTNYSDSLDDLWSSNPADFNDVPLDGCSFTVEVTDEAGKLNLNTATKDQLMEFPNMTEEIAASILDWRDEDDDIREGGAEAGYYVNLPYGYEIRNGNFKMVRELLLVKGVTQALLYGGSGPEITEASAGWINYLTCYSYENNQDSSGNSRININSANENRLRRGLDISRPYAKWIVDNRKDGFKSIGELISNNSPAKPKKNGNSGSGGSVQAEPLDMETFFNIADKITVIDEEQIPGKVNVNTAPVRVLVALFEGDEQLAADIVAYRSGLAGGLADIGDLGQVTGFARKDVAKKYIDAVTTRSSVYTINSLARAHATMAVHNVEAVVDRAESPARIVYWRAGAQN
ncbi:MAG: type II secretion system protein GspK [Planctomycetota bacterium]|jgi:type II secretory pathway component PulK